MIRDHARERMEAWKASDGASGSMTDAEGAERLLGEEKERIRNRMEETRDATRSNMNRAEYDDGAKTITVTKFSGKVIRNMGRTVAKKRRLFPEEALFLMESAALELIHNGIPLSLAQAYSLLLHSDGLSCDKYVAYGHLMRGGYTVVRHQPQSVSKPSNDDDNEKNGSSPGRKLSIVFDVYLTEAGLNVFKEQRPHHRLVVMGAGEEAVTVNEIRFLQSQVNDDVPIHAAVVDQADVTYFCLDWVVTPKVNCLGV